MPLPSVFTRVFSGLWLAAWVLLLFLAMGWAVWATYDVREERFRHQVEAGLGAVNELQVKGVWDWRRRRMSDAASLSDDALWAHAVAQWRAQPLPEHQEPVRERLRGLVEHLQYSASFLVDTEGHLLLSSQGAVQGRLAPAELQMLQRALDSAVPQSVGLRRDARFSYPYYGVLAPLYDGAQAMGAVWLVMDARASLFPILQTWPNSSASAESVLLERQGDTVTFMSPLRHRADAPLSLRFTLGLADAATFPALVSSVRGTLYASDYRGVEVVASVGAVPESDWVVASKIDATEAFTDAQRREWLTLALLGALALMLMGSLALLWQRGAWRRERQLKGDLQAQMRWLEAAQNAAQLGYYAFDTAARHYHASFMTCRIYGLPEGRVSSQQWMDCLHPEDRDRVLAYTREAVAEQHSIRMQHRVVRGNDRQVRWIEVLGDFAPLQGSQQLGVVGTVQDITARKQIEDQLEHYRQALEAKVRIDPLTQVANRLALNEAVVQEWARAQRSGEPLALLMIDVDWFKAFNDRYGHVNGDDCLRKVAVALSATMGRAGDLVARYGGEEFAVLLPETAVTEAAAVAERLRQSVRALDIAHAGGGAEKVVTVSIGVASLHPAQETSGAPVAGPDVAQPLFRQADAALYHAKSLGRNRVAVYGPQCEQPVDTDAPHSRFGGS